MRGEKMDVFVHHPGWLQAQLGQMLWTMQQKATLCDVTIHPAENAQQIKAHSAVLAAASPHLQRLFQSLQEGYYTLRTSNIPRHVWLYLIEFVYQGGVMVKEEHLPDVRRIARKLDIKLEPGSNMSPCDESGKGLSSKGGVIVIEDDDQSDSERQKDGLDSQQKKTETSNGIAAEVLSSISSGSAMVDSLLNSHSLTAVCSAGDPVTVKTTCVKPVASTTGIEMNNIHHDSDLNNHVDHSSDSQQENNSSIMADDAMMPDDDEEESEDPFVPSIQQVLKEATSRRKKSIPRKVIKDSVVATTNMYSITGDKISNVRPQIAEVMPTPHTRPSHMDTPLSQSPLDTNDMPPDGKRARIEAEQHFTLPHSIINIAPGIDHGSSTTSSTPSSLATTTTATTPAAPIPGLSLPVTIPVSLPDLSNMQGLMSAAPFLNLNPSQLFPNLQNLQLDAATAQLLTAQLLPNIAAGNNNPAGGAGGMGGMLYLPTGGPGGLGGGNPGLPLGLGGQHGLAGLGSQWGSVGNQGALAGGEKGTVDPGMFSVDDPPEEYNDFIQWVKAVRAKLRVSQTALSDALNNTPQLTKRYSQTIVSSFETFKMSRKEVAFLRPFIINILQNVAIKLGIKNA